jgi:hypothetical protein
MPGWEKRSMIFSLKVSGKSAQETELKVQDEDRGLKSKVRDQKSGDRLHKIGPWI